MNDTANYYITLKDVRNLSENVPVDRGTLASVRSCARNRQHLSQPASRQQNEPDLRMKTTFMTLKRSGAVIPITKLHRRSNTRDCLF